MIGALYFATDRRHYVWQAVLSATSLKTFMPDMKVSLLTTFGLEGPARGVFDNIRHVSAPYTTDHPYTAKIRCLTETPYDRTLFLDTDTFIAGTLRDMIPDGLDTLALANAAFTSDHSQPEVRFSGYNTGVIYVLAKARKNISTWLAKAQSEEHMFEMPGKDSTAERAAKSIGDQNVFNSLQRAEGWPVFRLNPLEYNFRCNLFQHFRTNSDVINGVRVFHMHNAVRELAGLDIPKYDQIVAQFRAVRAASTVVLDA